MDELKKIILSLCLAIISWIIKDLLIKSIIRKNDSVRAEWESRLKEVWSPLFYWSGIITLSDNIKGWQKHGIKELENILSKSAHLLPLNHYYNLIRLIEGATNQKTTPITLDQIKSTRDYIYKQIELLNYLLYRRETIYEAQYAVDIVAPYRFLLRVISGFIFHLLIWSLIAGTLTSFYFSYKMRMLWPFIVFAIIFSIIIYFDIKGKRETYMKIKKMLKE